MTLDLKQMEVLLQPINPARVATRDGMSHLQAWDVRRSLIRIFGHTGFDIEVLDLVQLYEQSKQEKDTDPPRWRAAYRATVRLVIRSKYGAEIAAYTEAAAGTNMGWLPDTKRDEAHDMAIKTAVSQATKRCAVNLGDQFGLSLYDKHHQAGPTVKNTIPYMLAVPEAAPPDAVPDSDDAPVVPDSDNLDVAPAADAAEPVDLDNDLTDSDAGEHSPSPDTTPVPDPSEDPGPASNESVEALATAIIEAARIPDKSERTRTVTRLGIEASKHHVQQSMTSHGITIGKLIDRAFTGVAP